jgi:hypothetical protein
MYKINYIIYIVSIKKIILFFCQYLSFLHFYPNYSKRMIGGANGINDFAGYASVSVGYCGTISS